MTKEKKIYYTISGSCFLAAALLLGIEWTVAYGDLGLGIVFSFFIFLFLCCAAVFLFLALLKKTSSRKELTSVEPSRHISIYPGMLLILGVLIFLGGYTSAHYEVISYVLVFFLYVTSMIFIIIGCVEMALGWYSNSKQS